MNTFTEILNETHLIKCKNYWISQGYDLNSCKRKYSKKYKFLGLLNGNITYLSANELIKLNGFFKIIQESDIIKLGSVKGCIPNYQYVGNVKLTLKTVDYFKNRLVVARYRGGVIVSLDFSDMPTLVFYKYGYSEKTYSEFLSKKEQLVAKHGYFFWDTFITN